MNKKVILASHGKLSEGMAHSVQMIIGENEALSYMGMQPGEHYQPLVDEVEKQLKENPDIQHIVIADLLGGSVCNGMMSLLGYPNMVLIAGMNMALVINLVLQSEKLSEQEIEGFIKEAKDINKRVFAPQIEEEEEFF